MHFVRPTSQYGTDDIVAVRRAPKGGGGWVENKKGVGVAVGLTDGDGDTVAWAQGRCWGWLWQWTRGFAGAGAGAGAAAVGSEEGMAQEAESDKN